MVHRKDIDGLRALAVLAVVIYHANIALSAGFLGVDVFFVISGYLITKIITEEQRQGSFTLLAFYERRVRRLLPVLVIVLLVSSVFAWNYLLPSDLVEYAQSLVAALGFVSNIFFYFLDDYHAAESATRPLLHTWSLGVEEQFYLLYPFLLMALVGCRERVRVITVSALAITSFLIAIVLHSSNPELNFYWLPSRFWELAIGALLALYLSNRSLRLNRATSETIAMIGLSLITASLFLFDSSDSHPGLVTLLPVLGTALVIFANNDGFFTHRVLSIAPVVWFGKLSYSIYLWHFPVFAFAYVRASGEDLVLIDRGELIVITLALSSLSYYLIERPSRRKNSLKFRHLITSLGVAVLGLLIWSSNVIKESGYPVRLGEIEKIFEGADRKDSFLLKDGRNCIYRPWVKNSCYFEAKGNKPSIYGMGDSHANMVSRPLHDYAMKNGHSFYNMILSHCPYVVDAWRITGFKSKCEVNQMDKIREYFNQLPPSIIVYTVRWPLYLNSRHFDNGEGGVEHSLFYPLLASDKAKAAGITVDKLIVRTVEELSAMGHTVIVVYPTPEVGWHVPKTIKEKLNDVPSSPVGRKRRAFTKIDVSTSYDVYKRRVAHSASILDRIQGKNVYRVYPHKLFCSEESGRCITHSDKKIYYYDDDHLSQAGAILLVNEIGRSIESARSSSFPE